MNVKEYRCTKICTQTRKFTTASIFASILILISALFTSCQDAQFNGDILEVMEQNLTSTVYFQKDADSPVAFSYTFKIGEDYSVSELPDNRTAREYELNPGFDLGGWKPLYTNGADDNAYTLDANGFIKSFHMTITPLTVYGAGYTAATDTPYKIIYKTQNLTMDGYEYYDERAMTGTTSTPEAPSYTDAAGNLLEITGFTALSSSIEEMEIAADGSTVVEVLYDRNAYTLTLHKNDSNAGTAAEETVQHTFYFEVPALIPANTFTYGSYTFAGWATSTQRAAAHTVDYTDGVYYTIGAADADLYAVWLLPHISVTIELPGANEVGITYSIETNKIILSAVLPNGAAESDYTYSWFYANEGFTNVRSTDSTWEINTTSLASGYYQVSLIAVRVADGMPSGLTVQIHKE